MVKVKAGKAWDEKVQVPEVAGTQISWTLPPKRPVNGAPAALVTLTFVNVPSAVLKGAKVKGPVAGVAPVVVKFWGPTVWVPVTA